MNFWDILVSMPATVFNGLFSVVGVLVLMTVIMGVLFYAAIGVSAYIRTDGFISLWWIPATWAVFLILFWLYAAFCVWLSPQLTT